VLRPATRQPFNKALYNLLVVLSSFVCLVALHSNDKSKTCGHRTIEPDGRKKRRNADDIEGSIKKAKSGQAEWEETNKEVT